MKNEKRDFLVDSPLNNSVGKDKQNNKRRVPSLNLEGISPISQAAKKSAMSRTPRMHFGKIKILDFQTLTNDVNNYKFYKHFK